MVLKPLEFSECIADTPWFRQNLHEHEVALEDAYKSIKNIETQCRELISCTRNPGITGSILQTKWSFSKRYCWTD
ncbi:hypothetical protein ANCDUO_12676 [Ancylostoma duodenale]|uniref:BAR domain-containing protein n=1 Tax=Ancylostoma duodenale TaxID=51022 RepID=A0A0C2GDY8_9BILA|nr:hypothetical protein ANCDUO_12676 [Ancylostoma duodenale]